MKGQTRLAPRDVELEDDDEPHVFEWKPVSLEDAILVALDEPALPGEQIAMAFQRKESVIGALFAQLDVHESRALHRRLELALPEDPIAARFGRLVADRRARLMAFLADARRRAARQLQSRH
jgi:hypothetical protein